jgi:ferredoxin
VPPAELPPAVLKADLDALAGMGIVFRRGTRVGADVTLDELRRTFAVVVLAVGAQGLPALALSGLKPWAERGTAGAAVHGDGAGLFACGSAVRSRPHVIQALADGMAAARAAIGFVEGSSRSPRFDCRIGRLKEGELAEFMKETDPGPRREPRAAGAGFDRDDAAREAGRCLHCDCRKPEACKLRAHAEEYGAGQDAFRGEDRNGFVRVVGHPDVIFEPGKCIRCGLCVQVTAQAGEKPGLAFIGRGYTQRVGVPFAESLAQALRLSAAECVAVCPTGALAWKRGE